MAIFRRGRNRGWAASLAEVQRDLKAAREESAVLAEQVASLRDDADALVTRSLVSENSADSRDARHAQGHVERFERQLERLREKIAALEAAEQEILNRPLFDD